VLSYIQVDSEADNKLEPGLLSLIENWGEPSKPWRIKRIVQIEIVLNKKIKNYFPFQGDLSAIIVSLANT